MITSSTNDHALLPITTTVPWSYTTYQATIGNKDVGSRWQKVEAVGYTIVRAEDRVV